MRICLVTGSLPSMDCGVGDYTWQLTRHLAASVGVTVVTSDRPAIRGFVAGLAEESRAAGGTPVDQGLPPSVLDASEPGVPGWEIRPIIGDWSLRSLPALRRAVLACRPDVVHIQYATSAFDTGAGVNWLAASLKNGRLRLPVVTTLHDPSGPRLFPKAGRLREAHVRMLCRSSDLVCCPDRLLRDWLTANNMGDRARQVPVGVNVAPARDFRATVAGSDPEREPTDALSMRLRREHPSVFSGGPVLVSFGNLHPDKDYESVLAALQRLTAEGSSQQPSRDWQRAQWVLVGGAGRGADTRRMREVEALAARAGLGGRVHLVGYAPPEQVSTWLGVADLCVMLLPQGATDARSSLLVALAHGKPTVVVGRGVFSDTMRDGEHLCWSPTGDPPRLAALLERLMADAATRARLGRAACQLTERHYGWPRIAEATIGIYREVTWMRGVPAFRPAGIQVKTDAAVLSQNLNARTPERRNAEEGGSA
jgi:glycosyltransferase involved in cell wall biosynthesis